MEPPTSKTAAATPLDGDLPIGERLVDEGLITPEQLEWALGVQERTGSRRGRS